MGALFGAIAALGIGISELYGRRVVALSSAITAALMLQVFGTVVAFASALALDGEPLAVDLLWGLLSGLGMAAGLGFYFAALNRSSSTVVAPTVATLAAVIPYVYALVRGESATALAIVGAVVAFVGLAVIAAGTAEITHLREGLIWGTLSGFSYGFGISVFVEASDDSGAWPAVTQRASAIVALAAVALVARAHLVPPRGVRVAAVWAGVYGGITSVALVLGLRANAPQAIVTSSMFPMVSVLLGFVYFSDPVARRQIAGIATALLGIAFVVGA